MLVKSNIFKKIMIALLMFISISAVININESESNTVQAAQIKGGTPGATYFRLYSMLLMNKKDTKETASDHVKVLKESGILHPVDKAMGDGGVTADMPYTYISAQGSAITNANNGDPDQGRMLASTLATYSNYGYMQTVSGNAIASGAGSILGGFGRAIGGFVGLLDEALSSMMTMLLKTVSKALVTILNVPNLLGFGQVMKNGDNNVIAKALKTFLSNFGINPQLFKAVSSIGFLIATAFFGFTLMRNLSSKGFNGSEMGSASKKWFVRILTFFVLLPLMGTFLAQFADGMMKNNDDKTTSTNPVISHILNTRSWAYTQNLAPNAVNAPNNNTVPFATAKNRYVDTNFDPSSEKVQKNIIAPINKASYAAQGVTDDSSIAFDLLLAWINNENFNINTYAGDIRGGTANPNQDLPIYYGSPSAEQAKVKPVEKKVGDETVTLPAFGTKDERKLRRDLGAYIWTADQHPTEDNIKPDGKSEEQGIPFDAYGKTGVQGTSTFSTQSVALLLQSGLDSQGIHFYGYNIPPQGMSATVKNISTVKTEWKTAALVGQGPVGKFSSWLEMITQSAVHLILTLMALVALMKVSFFSSFKKGFTRAYQIGMTGNPAYGAGLFSYSIAVIIVAVIALKIPDWFSPLIASITSAALGFLTQSNMGAITQLINCLLTALILYFFVFKRPEDGSTPLETVMEFPMTFAENFDKNALLYLANDGSRMSRMAKNALNKTTDDIRNGEKDSIEERNERLKEALTNSDDSDKPTNSSNNSNRNAGLNSNEGRDAVRKAKEKQDRAAKGISKDGDVLLDADGNPINNGAGSLKDNQHIDPKTGQIFDDDGNLIDPKTGLPVNGSESVPHDLNEKNQGLPSTNRENEENEDGIGLSDAQVNELAASAKNSEEFKELINSSENYKELAFSTDEAKNKLSKLPNSENFISKDQSGNEVTNYKAIQDAISAGESTNATIEEQALASRLQEIQNVGASSMKNTLTGKGSTGAKLSNKVRETILSGAKDDSIIGQVNKGFNKANAIKESRKLKKELAEKERKEKLKNKFK